MLECVVNVSEGRDPQVLRALADACAASLVDLHADPDHHRSVFTLAAPSVGEVSEGARALAAAVAEHVSLEGHDGVHPRLGALGRRPLRRARRNDGGNDDRRARPRGRSGCGGRRSTTCRCSCTATPTPRVRNLPTVRRQAFRVSPPDFGPAEPHPRLGASAVGARKPLVAINCLLVAREIDIARRIARDVRERNGGLPGVRALGFLLETEGRAQVSMNLVDLDLTGVQDACLHVRELARAERTDIASVELVGLLPRRELDRCFDDFLEWSGLDAEATIEARVGIGPRTLAGLASGRRRRGDASG